jgi:hypothetical protein
VLYNKNTTARKEKKMATTYEGKEFIVTFPGSETNYDLNIWDRRGYETEYAEEGWAISVYEIPHIGSPYGSGEFREDLSFDLTPEEAKSLTLGWDPALGGDYCPDSDFWLDVHGFMDTYTNIPARVRELLENLP